MYKFSIKIDDDLNSLSKEQGVSFDKIGELLQNLYEAIDPKSALKCTLGQIRGNCYALDFYTEEEKYLENFIVVHKDIEDIPYSELNESQKKYAKTLKKVLGDKYYLTAFDSDNHKIASIKQLEVSESTDKVIDVYYTLKTVYGIVSQLGGASLDSSKKHIRIDGINYNIKISKDQDIKLKQYYGTDKLRIKIRQRRSRGKGRVIDAELISFIPVSHHSLLNNLKNEGYIDIYLIKDTETIDDIVNKLHR